MKKCFIIVSWVASYKKEVQVQLYFHKVFKNETLSIGGSEVGNHFFFLQKMRMNFIQQRSFFLGSMEISLCKSFLLPQCQYPRGS